MKYELKEADRDEVRQRFNDKAQDVASQIEAMNGLVESTHFVGKNAEDFTQGMNAQVTAFAKNQQENVDQVMKFVSGKMNEVFASLGQLDHGVAGSIEIPILTVATAKTGTGVQIETDEVTQLGTKIEEHMTTVKDLFLSMAAYAIDGTAGWVEPRKPQIIDSINNQVGTVIITDIEKSVATLKQFVDDQAATMEALT